MRSAVLAESVSVEFEHPSIGANPHTPGGGHRKSALSDLCSWELDPFDACLCRLGTGARQAGVRRGAEPEQAAGIRDPQLSVDAASHVAHGGLCRGGRHRITHGALVIEQANQAAASPDPHLAVSA